MIIRSMDRRPYKPVVKCGDVTKYQKKCDKTCDDMRQEINKDDHYNMALIKIHKDPDDKHLPRSVYDNIDNLTKFDEMRVDMKQDLLSMTTALKMLLDVSRNFSTSQESRDVIMLPNRSFPARRITITAEYNKAEERIQEINKTYEEDLQKIIDALTNQIEKLTPVVEMYIPLTPRIIGLHRYYASALNGYEFRIGSFQNDIVEAKKDLSEARTIELGDMIQKKIKRLKDELKRINETYQNIAYWKDLQDMYDKIREEYNTFKPMYDEIREEYNTFKRMYDEIKDKYEKLNIKDELYQEKNDTTKDPNIAPQIPNFQLTIDTLRHGRKS